MFNNARSGVLYINVGYADNRVWTRRTTLPMQKLRPIKSTVTAECAHLQANSDPGLSTFLEARWIGDTDGEVEIVEITWIIGPTVLLTHLISLHIMHSYRATFHYHSNQQYYLGLWWLSHKYLSSVNDISTQIQLDISSVLSKHQIALRNTVGRVCTLLMLIVNCRAPQPLQNGMMPGWVRMKDIDEIIVICWRYSR